MNLVIKRNELALYQQALDEFNRQAPQHAYGMHIYELEETKSRLIPTDYPYMLDLGEPRQSLNRFWEILAEVKEKAK